MKTREGEGNGEDPERGENDHCALGALLWVMMSGH